MFNGRGGLGLLAAGRTRRFVGIADLTVDPSQHSVSPIPLPPPDGFSAGTPGPLTLISCDGQSPWVQGGKDKDKDNGHWTWTKTTLPRKLTQEMLDNDPHKIPFHSGDGPIPVQWQFRSGADLTFQGWVGQSFLNNINEIHIQPFPRPMLFLGSLPTPVFWSSASASLPSLMGPT